MVAAVDGRHASASARIRRGVAPVATSKGQGGGSLHAFDGVARAVTSKGRGGLSLSSAKRLLCGSTGEFVVSFFFWGVFCPRFFVLRPSTGDTLRLRLRRAASPLQTDISLSRRSRLLPCTRCSARSRRARRSRCKMQMSEGGFCRSAALRDCWLLELTSELFSCVFGLFSFRLFLFFFFGCGILSLSSAKRLLVG